MRFVTIASSLLVAVAGLSAADISIQTVDGLGRPISGVQIDIDCVSPEQTSLSFHLNSEPDGMAHGSYDPTLCVLYSVRVEKQGYASYRSGFRSRYVLN